MVELPSVYGLEHERRLVAEPGGHIQDTAVLSEILLTSDICPDGSDVGGFSLTNSSRHYVDSHTPDENTETHGNNATYETATPETTSLRELRKYTLAADRQAIGAIQQHLTTHPGILAVVYNHQATLGRDNTYGSQVNYGITHNTAWEFGYESDYPGNHFAQSIVNASFLTGGGALHGVEVSLSQKVDGLVAVRGRWGNRGTIYQLPSKRGESSTVQRVELRLTDSHPDEWPNYMQAGIGGIALAVAQLPQDRLERKFGVLKTDEALLRLAREQNKVTVDSEGILHAPTPLTKATDWTLRLAETFLDLPRQGKKGEEDLVITAQEAIAYCDLFKRALAKRATIHDLAEQGAGWAKRVAYVSAATSQTGIIDFSRAGCNLANAAYDLVRIEPNRITFGAAFTPDTLPTRWQLTEQEIEHAAKNPPNDTVAAYRIGAMRANQSNIASMNWSRIHFWRADGTLDTIYTSNPLNSTGDS